MNTCFRCGRAFERGEWQFRRKVKVGETVSRSFPFGKLARVHSRFAVQVFCHTCERRVKSLERTREIRGWLELAGILLGLVILLSLFFAPTG